MKWTTRSLWWRGPLLRGLDRLHRWYILRYCTLSKHGYGPNAKVSGAGTASAGLPGYAGDNNGERK